MTIPPTWFQPLSIRHAFWVSAVVGVVTLVAALQASLSRGDLRSPPSSAGDEAGYHALAKSLAAGRGFGYQRENSGEPASGPEIALTAYRPPGFPVMVAALYLVSPDNYVLVRCVNCLCLSLAMASVAFVFAHQVSPVPALAVGVLGSIDPRTREFAGAFLTENSATLLMSLYVITTVWCVQRKSAWSAACCGLSFSALVFVRSFFVAWYPAIWIVMAWVLLRPRLGRPRLGDGVRWSKSLRVFGVFAICSLVLTGPWWVRNCVVLDAIMPTGTQGGIGIADGFSDSAFANQGDWASTTADRIASEMRQQEVYQNLSPLEFERELCRLGVAHAKQWFQQNPEKIPLLTWWKVSKLWGWDAHVAHQTLFLLAFVGMFALRQHPLGRVTFFLLVLNTLTVIATYYTYERFMTPFRPLLYAMACYGVQVLVRPNLVQRWRNPRFVENVTKTGA